MPSMVLGSCPRPTPWPLEKAAAGRLCSFRCVSISCLSMTLCMSSCREGEGAGISSCSYLALGLDREMTDVGRR